MTGLQIWPRGVLLCDADVFDPHPRPPGTAVAVLDDRIVAVGSEAECSLALPEGHGIFRLRGKSLIPGFVDAHTHPLPAAFFQHHLDLSGARSLEDVFDLLSQRAANIGPGDTVFGFLIDDADLAEGRLPTRVELDAVAGGRPVVLLRRDGHHAIGSSLALANAGFTNGQADPVGGRLGRDDGGKLDGLCGEKAASTLLGTIPVPEWQELSDATDAWVDRLMAAGVTALSAIVQTTDEGPSGAAGEMEAIGWSALVDRIPLDLQTIVIADSTDGWSDLAAMGLHAPERGRRLDGFKIFLDGTLGGRTACMHQAYADDDSTSGFNTIAGDVAWKRMEQAHLAGLSICVHAIGDRANRDAAEMFAQLLKTHPVDRHLHRVEHASVAEPETIEALASAGVAAVVQPSFLASEHRWLLDRLGPDRLANAYPFRSLLDAGVTVASSSDAPIEAVEVLPALQAAVDRFGVAPEQALTPVEALAIATIGSSTVRGTDGTLARLAPGYRADLVILDGNPFTGSTTDGFDTTEVVVTMIGGRVVHGDLNAVISL